MIDAIFHQNRLSYVFQYEEFDDIVTLQRLPDQKSFDCLLSSQLKCNLR